MKQKLKKPLALLLTLAMCLSLLPVGAMAAGETWTKIELADIMPEDTIAITMTKSGTTYVLPNNGGTASAPAAVVGTFEGAKLTNAPANLSWKISGNNTDGYVIATAADATKLLYTTDTNNGVRVGTSASNKWVVEGTYLKCPAIANRYLGVYNSQDWRAYTTNTGTSNITGQTLAFYKLDINTPSATKIAAPTAAIGLKYTGSEQTGVAEGTGYTLSGTVKATNAGNYQAIATLATNYVWNDDSIDAKTIAWSIGKADAPAAPTGLAGVAPTTVNGLDGKITGVADTMEWKKAADADTAYASVVTGLTEITGLEAGSYHVRVKEDANHAGPGLAAAIEVPAFTPANTVATPTATPGTGAEVKAGDEITLSTTTSGADIKYTVNDGSTTSNELTYTDTGIIIPDLANGTVITVKAKATLVGWTDSTEATFTYTVKKDAPVNVMTIAEARSKAAGTEVTVEGIYTGQPYASSGTSRNYIYMQDATGGIVVGIPASFPVALGNTVKAKGNIDAISGLVSIGTATAPATVEVTKTDTAVPAAAVITIAQLNSGAYEGQYVEVKGVTLKTKTTGTGHRNHVIEKGTDTVEYYANLNDASITAGKTYDIKGWASKNNTTLQLLMRYKDGVTTAAYEITEVSAPPVKTAPPTATPAGGTDNSTAVEKEANTFIVLAATGADKIYYTINGSTPTTSSTEYGGAIALTGSVGSYFTIKAIATKAGSENSEVLTAVYKIIAGTPATEYGVNVTNGTANPVVAAQGVSVTVTATVPSDKEFVKWTATGLTLTSAQETANPLSFTMPGNAVSFTATLKDKDVPQPSGGHVVINQIYGGAGSNTPAYNKDFVELYNPTDAPVSLSGMSLQYGSATSLEDGTKAYALIANLSGTIAAKSYFLVIGVDGKKTDAVNTVPEGDLDVSGNTPLPADISGSNGKVALVNGTTLIKQATDASIIDFVGFGTANAYEGTKAAPAGSVANAIVRKVDGVDTNDNFVDFEAKAANPRNSKSGGGSTEPETLTAPKATPASGSVVLGGKVKIDAVSSATMIKYTTDGTVPTQPQNGVGTSVPGHTTEIALPGNVGDTVTLKAIALRTKDGSSEVESSPVLSTTYNIIAASEAKNVKEVLSLPDPGTTGVPVIVQGELVYRTSYPDGTNDGAVIQSVVDGTTYSIFVYKGVLGDALYTIGDTVKLTGTYKIYSKLPEIDGYTAEKVSNSTPSAPVVKTIAQAKAISTTPANGAIGSYILLKNVTIGATTLDSNGKNPNTAITDSTGTMNIYNAATEGLNVGDVVDIRAVVVVNNSNVQLRTGTPALNGGTPVYIVGDDVRPPVITLPTFLSAAKGQDYIVSITITDNVGVAEAKLTYTVPGGQAKTVDLVRVGVTNEWKFTIPASELTQGGDLILSFNAKDAKPNAAETKTATVSIIDNPQVTDAKPTGDKIAKQPTIEVTFSNAPTATAKLTLKQGETVVVDNGDMTVNAGKATYAVTADLVDGIYTATIIITRDDNKSITYTWSFTVGEASSKFYFGQLHSHTAQYSDGAGTLAQALSYIKNITKDKNVQFVAFTDHSNYFDATGTGNFNAAEALYDASKMTAASKIKWDTYKGDIATFNAQLAQNGILALGGFEMTWSGGPGHINTFNTPGIVSRNNTSLNSKSSDAGMKLYYETLKKADGSISQFNHPGTTFGTFSEFAYWDKDIDKKITLVEVGNGEGAIGSGGYFPSYSEYTKALDKGWHVAPTNNQDNHKGNWGDANDARTVALVEGEFNEQNLYKALQNRAVYATEDKNLSIDYTLNGNILGSIIDKPESNIVKIRAVISDPDTGNLGDKIATVEVISNGGRVVKSWTGDSHSGTFEAELPVDYSYYYLRVTQADKNIAVTAPVWVGKASVVGIGSFTSSTVIPVTGEEITFTTNVFNSEDTTATVKSIQYDLDGNVLETLTPNDVIPATNGTKNYIFKFTPSKATDQTLTVTVVMGTESGERTYSVKLLLEVLDPANLVYVGVDGSHQNEYVAGNYYDSMGNFTKVAAGYGVRVNILKTSAELLEATANPKYKMLVLTAPSRRNGSALRSPYDNYTQAEVDAIAAFGKKAGNTVVISGWADYYESYASFPAVDHMAAQQNKLLAAIGSQLRVSDDEAKDATNSAGGPTNTSSNYPRLYLSNFNRSHPLLNGVVYNGASVFDSTNVNEGKCNGTQIFSQYGGSTIYVVDGTGNASGTIPSGVSPMVYGYATTYSSDDDKDGLGGTATPKYAAKEYDPLSTTEKDISALMVMATENLADGGRVIVSGGAFMSNFEIKPDLDNVTQLSYANLTILENILADLNQPEITPIASVQAAPEGERFTIEGTLTSNVSGYDKDTAFFDCSYLQDSTGGINIFPISGNFKEGQKLRITGTTSSYQGERQLAIKSVKLLDQNVSKVEPKLVSTMDIANNKVLGQLIKIEGVIVSFAEAEGAIQTILVRDSSGGTARVFIDGYITSGDDATLRINLKAGNKITVIGLASYDNSFDGPAPRIRIRDRADIVCLDEQVEIPGEKLNAPIPSTGSGEVTSGTKVTFTVPEGATAMYKTSVDGEFTSVPAEGVAITGIDGASIKLWVKAVKAGAQDSDVVELTYTIMIKLETPTASIASGSVVTNGTKVTFTVPEGATAMYKTSVDGEFTSVPAEGVAISGIGGTSVKLWVKATKVGATDSDEVELSYTIKKIDSTPSTGGSTNLIVKPDDVKVGEKAVEVKLPSAGAKLNDAANEKVVAANADKPIAITGGGLTVTIPAGTLTEGTDVNALLVNPKATGSVIKVTKPDGTTSILPIATMNGGKAAYVANILGKYEVVDNAKTFPDTGDHWALPAISFVSARELFKGDNTGAFRPDQPMTRGMLATVLARIDGGKASVGTPFADVSSGSWYAKEIAWAAQNKLVEGDGKNFNPDADLTREQLCVILIRYLNYSGLTLAETTTVGDFSDLSSVSPWAKDAMEQAVKAGLINGKTGGRLDPQGKATRAEISTILQRFVEGVLK